MIPFISFDYVNNLKKRSDWVFLGTDVPMYALLIEYELLHYQSLCENIEREDESRKKVSHQFAAVNA